jgi:hypothetical protein
LTDAPFECGPGNMDVTAFAEAASIIGGCDAVKEYLAYDIWPLSEGVCSGERGDAIVEGCGAHAEGHSHYWQIGIRGGFRKADRCQG